MITPINIEKQIKDWSFDDLCKWAAWEVATGMLNGKSLKSSMSYVLDVALRWKTEK